MASPTPFFLIPGVDQRNSATSFPVQPDSILSHAKPGPSNQGRKPGLAPTSLKKQRRRGLGVAQLEKIFSNRTTEINQQPTANPFSHVQMGLPMMVNNIGYFDFGNGNGFNGNSNVGPFWSNPFVFETPDQMRVHGSSSELASMPTLVRHYDCDSCCKCAKVAKVHRKMEAKGRSVFMEYEFFPNHKKDTDFKEMEKMGLRFQDPKTPSRL